MSLAGKDDHGGWPFQKLQRAEQLLTARILRSAVVGFAQHKQDRGVDILHKCNGGAAGIVLRILEGRCFEPEWLKESEIGGIPPRGPVRNVALRDGRGEPIRVRDCPVGEHTATAAAGYTEFLRVDVPTFEDFVHADHQVAVVVARIVILNEVAKILAVAGGAARVDVQNDVAFGRHPLKFVIKDPTVGSVRPAVNVQNERVFLFRIKVRRLLNPSLDALAIEAGVIDLLRRRQLELRPELAVEVGNAGLSAHRRNGEQIADHKGRRDQGNDGGSVPSNAKIQYGLIALSDFGYGAGLRIDPDEGRASLFLDGVEQPAAVRRPVEPATAPAARSGVVAEDRATHIEVIIDG